MGRWSIGCVVGELVQGCPLLDGKTDIDQIQKMIQCLGPPPSHLYDTSYYMDRPHKQQQQQHEQDEANRTDTTRINQRQYESSDERYHNNFSSRRSRNSNYTSNYTSNTNSNNYPQYQQQQQQQQYTSSTSASASCLPTSLWDKFDRLGMSSDFLTLITNLLEYDPNIRWTAQQALRSKYFAVTVPSHSGSFASTTSTTTTQPRTTTTSSSKCVDNEDDSAKNHTDDLNATYYNNPDVLHAVMPKHFHFME